MWKLEIYLCETNGSHTLVKVSKSTTDNTESTKIKATLSIPNDKFKKIPVIWVVKLAIDRYIISKSCEIIGCRISQITVHNDTYLINQKKLQLSLCICSYWTGHWQPKFGRKWKKRIHTLYLVVIPKSRNRILEWCTNVIQLLWKRFMFFFLSKVIKFRS